ncbi:hypothetical protein JQK19_03625 [Chromobacterium violaceum]|uniref:hypothetical protein n=1 Tax=Chromobacterium violaceum TaxID=536 RepID=UPI001BED3621|nr:hypothetical protein [Chromobacterium violaceum]MBT2866321.1 hypothetical protein [Chromobacterium violaceum]
MVFSEFTPREELTVNEVAADILSRCLDFHREVWPERSAERDKIEKAYTDHLMEIEVSGDRVLQGIQEQARSNPNEQISTQGALFVIAQNYAIEVIQANARGNVLLAEKLLLDACFWCGNMWGSLGAGKAITQSAKSARSKVASDAAKKRADEYEPLRNEVDQYVRENGPWKSRLMAAEIISERSVDENSGLHFLFKVTVEKRKKNP